MPTLIVEHLPGEIYERLQRRAEAKNRTLTEEVVRLLEEGLNGPAQRSGVPVETKDALSPRLPDPPILDTGEIPPPCTLPRPGVGVLVPTVAGGVRRPTSILIEEESDANHV